MFSTYFFLLAILIIPGKSKHRVEVRVTTHTRIYSQDTTVMALAKLCFASLRSRILLFASCFITAKFAGVEHKSKALDERVPSQKGGYNSAVGEQA